MGFEGFKFGAGAKELGGAVDLVSHYKLWPLHEIFCKKSLPLSISETHYLKNVVGDKEIRKGDGMELDQLFQDVTLLRDKNRCIHPFQLDVLADVFYMRQTTNVNLSSIDRGTPTAVTKLESKPNERHHKKDKGRDHKQSKHRNKDKSGNEVRGKIINELKSNNSDHLKNREKKRKLGEITHHMFTPSQASNK